MQDRSLQRSSASAGSSASLPPQGRAVSQEAAPAATIKHGRFRVPECSSSIETAASSRSAKHCIPSLFVSAVTLAPTEATALNTLSKSGYRANGKLGGQGSSAHLNFRFADQPSIQPSRKSIDFLRKVE